MVAPEPSSAHSSSPATSCSSCPCRSLPRYGALGPVLAPSVRSGLAGWRSATGKRVTAWRNRPLPLMIRRKSTVAACTLHQTLARHLGADTAALNNRRPRWPRQCARGSGRIGKPLTALISHVLEPPRWTATAACDCIRRPSCRRHSILVDACNGRSRTTKESIL